MKKLFTILFISFGASVLLGQAWQKIAIPVTNSLNEFYVKDPQNIVAVGSNGTLVKSTDGGLTFQNIVSGTDKNLTSVACTNQNCFVLAENKILVSSDNQTWNMYDLPDYGAKIYFYQRSIGFITGCKKGILMKSTNGGSTWEVIQTNQPKYNIKTISMTSETNGFAIAHDVNLQARSPIGKILKTIDGGGTWTEVSSINDHSYNALQMINASNGFAVGIFGKVITTNDGGNTWTPIDVSTNENLQSVYFADANVGYVVGTSGKVLKTTNGGATWQHLNTGANDFFRSCSFSDLNNGYVLGGKQILKTSTGGL